jgi:hypothetical protein
MITVPAGTFKAIRIQAFERRYSEEYWWAPSARMSVKIDTSANWHAELIAFELKAPKTK